ncbi:MAG: hypothetical protein ACN6OC_04760 [Alcaligenes sp.]
MKISSNNCYTYINHESRKHSENSQINKGFSDALTATTASKKNTGTTQIDFTKMSNIEMFNWMNNQIKNGEISLDKSFPFLAMTIRIPVSGNVTELTHEKINFIEKIRDGIAGARSRNDENTLKMLEKAMAVIQRFQGQAIGVDAHA